MFDNLQDRLDDAFKTLKGKGQITEVNVASTVKEIRRALVEADVNYKIAKEFTDRVRKEAMGQKVLTAVDPGQLMVKVVKDELTKLMGGEVADFNIDGHPAVILLAGLQGSGKTTFAAKIANFLKNKKSKKVLLVAADVYRPAAIDQLHILAEQVGVEVYSDKEQQDAIQIAKDGLAFAKQNNFNTVVVDTAGRQAVNDILMTEISNIKKAIQPNETLFVVDSMIGQDAVSTAKAFHDKLNFDGVVLTKLDGDTRGGAALSIKWTIDKPIKFISRGEKLDAIDVFHPDRMAQRILGMGDIVTLVEKAQEQYDEKEAKKLERKIKKNKFDFDDFLSQIKQIKKMGNMKDLLGMMPGVGKAIKDIDIDDDAFKSLEAMITSMTPEERGNPEIINSSRRRRIAKGSGTTIQEVNQFMKQFDQMKKMMKMMSGGGSLNLPNLPFGK